jgi:hypothetical protein
VIQKQVRRTRALQSQGGWCSIAAIALLLDLALTGVTFFRIRLDGDLARVAGPVASYRAVLRDPWGLRASESTRYPGAGRYMAHITTKLWADFAVSVVNVISREPVRSLYLTLALTAVAIQLLFVVIGCAYLHAFRPMSVRQTVASALGLSLFVQLGSLHKFFGILDYSIAYTFAYAFPILALLGFFWPVYRSLLSPEDEPTRLTAVCLVVAATYLAFNGPLVQPIVVLVGLFLFIAQLRNRKKRLIVHRRLIPGLGLLGLASIWGMYIARFNSESEAAPLLGFRYRLLGRGLMELLIRPPSPWLILLTGISLNYLFVRRRLGPREFSRLRVHLLSGGCFTVLWLALLPLGGFRSYRPLVLRYDTLLPVTLVAVYFFVLTFRLALSGQTDTVQTGPVKNAGSGSVRGFPLFFQKILIAPAIFLGLLLAIGKDPVQPLSNACERKSLESLRDAEGEQLGIPRLCTVGTWTVQQLDDPDYRQALTKLLRSWQIIQPNQTLK